MDSRDPSALDLFESIGGRWISGGLEVRVADSCGGDVGKHWYNPFGPTKVWPPPLHKDYR